MAKSSKILMNRSKPTRQLAVESPACAMRIDLFAARDCVEVVMIATESPSAAQVETLHSLLKTTQALPQARALTDARPCS
jgi:hypothetical protein